MKFRELDKVLFERFAKYNFDEDLQKRRLNAKLNSIFPKVHRFAIDQLVCDAQAVIEG